MKARGKPMSGHGRNGHAGAPARDSPSSSHGNGRANGRRRGGDALTIQLDAATGRPLYRQIYSEIRRAVVDGRLRPGTRLPSTRTLSGDLGVSRNTVLTAYDHLQADSLIVGRTGAGTRVNPRLLGLVEAGGEGGRTPFRGPVSGAAERLSRLGRGEGDQPLGSERGSLTAATEAFARSSFPWRPWLRRLRAAGSRSGRAASDGLGTMALREAIGEELGTWRGIRCDPEQVVLAAGRQEALELALRAVAEPGDAIAVDRAVNPALLGCLAACGLVAVPPGDDAPAEAGSPCPRAIHVTPSHRLPLGAALGLDARKAVLERASAAGCWVIEDDVAAALDRSHRHPAIRSLDRDDRVVYVGGLGDVFGGSADLGYAVVPAALFPNILALSAWRGTGRTVEQRALAGFVADGAWARHRRRVRRYHEGRTAAIHRAAREELAGRPDVAGVTAGLHVVAWLGRGVSDVAVARAASDAGVGVVPVSALQPWGGYPSGVILTLDGIPDDGAGEALRTLHALPAWRGESG